IWTKATRWPPPANCPKPRSRPRTRRICCHFSKLGRTGRGTLWVRLSTLMGALTSLSTRGSLDAKQRQLLADLSAMGRVIMAFSGGTDSAYLAWAANRALGTNAVAITADSASLPESHKRDAEAFVARFGIAHEYVATGEFDNPEYVA